MNDLNLHNVTSVRVGQIQTLEKDNGETFVTRHFIFESKEKGNFGVTVYGEDLSDVFINLE